MLDQADDAGEGAFCVRSESERQQEQKDNLAVGGAVAVSVKAVWNVAFQNAAHARPAADLAVVHEQIAVDRKGMTVGPDRRGAGRRAHMRKKQRGANLVGDREQVLVAPGRPHVTEQTWPLALAVPADPETIRVEPGFGFAAMPALRDETLTGLRDEVLEENRLAEIRQPSAHVVSLLDTADVRPGVRLLFSSFYSAG